MSFAMPSSNELAFFGNMHCVGDLNGENAGLRVREQHKFTGLFDLAFLKRFDKHEGRRRVCIRSR